MCFDDRFTKLDTPEKFSKFFKINFVHFFHTKQKLMFGNRINAVSFGDVFATFSHFFLKK